VKVRTAHGLAASPSAASSSSAADAAASSSCNSNPSISLRRSTVASDAVRELKARLGVLPLQRTTRQVSPTLDGEANSRRCLTILADIEDAEGGFAGTKPKGLLRVDVPGTLARHFVRPNVPAFLQRYADIGFYTSEETGWSISSVRVAIACCVSAHRKIATWSAGRSPRPTRSRLARLLISTVMAFPAILTRSTGTAWPASARVRSAARCRSSLSWAGLFGRLSGP